MKCQNQNAFKVCGGMVDNDNIELASGKMKLKADAKGSWR